MKDAGEMAPPEHSRRRPALAFVCVGVSIVAAVAAVALVSQQAGLLRAVALGFSALVIWAALDGVAPFGPRRALRAVSLHALSLLAIVLCVSRDVWGFGLDPIDAVAAVALAAFLSALTVALARRAGLLHSNARALVVGSGVVADALVTALAREGRSTVVGRIDDGDDPELLGDLAAFEHVVRQTRATTVIFAYSHARDGRLAEVAAHARELGLVVAMVPRLFDQFDRRVRTRNVAGVPLLIVEPRPHEAPIPALARIFDVIAALILLVATSPIWVLVAIAIFIEEPGAIFYRADRIGLGGRHFRMFKFRKMRRDAAGPRLTSADDPRFTRIGGLLARTKLDELPQLLNVLRAEMGLVGPRPEDPSYVSVFPDEFAEIQRVRPGITGLSQIQYRDESALLVGDDFDELYRNELLPNKISLDRYYATHRCLALDLRILAWTLVAVVAGARIGRNELTRTVRFERHDLSVGVDPDATDAAVAGSSAGTRS
jgi:lipopolysaccharide/colanic/teichoic acid biosynthesis glycosyltransferase